MKKHIGVFIFLLCVVIHSNAQERSVLEKKPENKDRLSRYISRKLSEKEKSKVYENQNNIIFDGTNTNYIWAEQLNETKLFVKYMTNNPYFYEIIGDEIFQEIPAEGTRKVIAKIKKEANTDIAFLRIDETSPEQQNNTIGHYNPSIQRIFNHNNEEVGQITGTNNNYQIINKHNEPFFTMGEVNHSLGIFFFLYDYLPLKSVEAASKR